MEADDAARLPTATVVYKAVGLFAKTMEVVCGVLNLIVVARHRVIQGTV